LLSNFSVTQLEQVCRTAVNFLKDRIFGLSLCLNTKRKRSMKYFAGLDVSVQATSVCVVDETGRICREMKVVSHPDDLIRALKNPDVRPVISLG
jgi:hypothetical protein